MDSSARPNLISRKHVKLIGEQNGSVVVWRVEVTATHVLLLVVLICRRTSAAHRLQTKRQGDDPQLAIFFLATSHHALLLWFRALLSRLATHPAGSREH